MTRELFVSSTPHETKVGMVEDDLLAEIYLERENEYTLAGSIYKGRVTRVLPGMKIPRTSTMFPPTGPHRSVIRSLRGKRRLARPSPLL
jgi:hypothetical protein